jgi:hypothetical protein
VITGDESWVYGYDPETKVQSSQWKHQTSSRPKKARQVQSNVKVILFSSITGVLCIVIEDTAKRLLFSQPQGHHTERDGAAAHHYKISLPEVLPAMEGPLG